MALSFDDVTQISKLSLLALSDDEKLATLSQLNGIFAVIEQMKAIDTEGVDPLTTPLSAIAAIELRLREDQVTETDQRERFQREAPKVKDGLYLVPRVVE